MALTLASKAVSSRSPLPVLSNILLEADGDEGSLRVTGTNLEVAVTQRIRAVVPVSGRILLPAKLTTQFVNALVPGMVEMAVDDKTRTITTHCGAHRTKLHGGDPTEYPPLPEADHLVAALPAAELAKAIRQVAFAASTDAARPVQNGVSIATLGRQMTLAATDGHRLAVRRLGLSCDVDTRTEKLIVPVTALKLVGDAVAPTRERLQLHVSRVADSRLYAEVRTPFAHFIFGGENWENEVEIRVRLIEGAYPNYAQVIPASTSTDMVISAGHMLSELKASAVIAKDSAGVVRLSLARVGGDRPLTIRCTSPDVGEDEAKLPAQITGDGLEVAFNAQFVLDALEACGPEEVEWGCNDWNSPTRIRLTMTDDMDDYVQILMPVNLPEKAEVPK